MCRYLAVPCWHHLHAEQTAAPNNGPPRLPGAARDHPMSTSPGPTPDSAKGLINIKTGIRGKEVIDNILIKEGIKR